MTISQQKLKHRSNGSVCVETNERIASFFLLANPWRVFIIFCWKNNETTNSNNTAHSLSLDVVLQKKKQQKNKHYFTMAISTIEICFHRLYQRLNVPVFFKGTDRGTRIFLHHFCYITNFDRRSSTYADIHLLIQAFQTI